MSTIADEINSQVNAGRRIIKDRLDDMPSLDASRVPRPAYLAAGIVVVAAAFGVGWMIYRSRRRRSLVDRLQGVLPDSVKDLPEGIRAQVRRPLEKAVRAL